MNFRGHLATEGLFVSFCSHQTSLTFYNASVKSLQQPLTRNSRKFRTPMQIFSVLRFNCMSWVIHCICYPDLKFQNPLLDAWYWLQEAWKWLKHSLEYFEPLENIFKIVFFLKSHEHISLISIIESKEAVGKAINVSESNRQMELWISFLGWL